MKITLLIALLFTFYLRAAIAAESGDKDREQPLVAKGVLGTVNVLRELDAKTFSNRVKVTANVEGMDSTPEETIDGSGKYFRPKVEPSDPVVLTYALPGVRTVSSLTIAYEYPTFDSPDQVRLEASADGGQSWTKVFESAARNNDLIKAFAPIQANALRLTQSGDGTDKSRRRTKEICAYADPETPDSALGSGQSGRFNFLRNAWYAGEIQQHLSPKTDVWSRPFGGKSFPHVPFGSHIANGHDGAWGGSDEVGKRVFLRLDLHAARQMEFGVIGSVPDGEGNRMVLGATSQAEFYTAIGRLDPGKLAGSSIEDITGQGWILQKAWSKDSSPLKSFGFAKPGKYDQMLIVWDGLGLHPMPNNWGRLEMYGAEPNIDANDSSQSK